MKEETGWILSDLIVKYKDKGMSLNPALIVRQGITDMGTINELKQTHEDRFRIFEAMENTNDVKDLKEFAFQFECLEYEQQKLWGFPQDRNFHCWYDVPKCSCPKMDNADNKGSEYRIISADCPIHSIKK